MTRNLLSTLFAAAISLSFVPASHADDTRQVTVYKSPWCSCCKVWTDRLEAAGYTIKSHDLEDLTAIKRQAGVTDELEACHTAVLDGYVLEGHVPLQAIDKLLAERPEITGISVPGMPAGSLGMGYDEAARYDVYAYSRDADTAPTVFYQAGKR